MKQMLKHIDTRFDRIDGQFSDVNRKIDKSRFSIKSLRVAAALRPSLIDALSLAERLADTNPMAAT
jgi:hypothetical protein